jgi:hypothetical protein
MKIRGSSRGSYYQAGKNWAARKLRYRSDREKNNLIDLFEIYKSPTCKKTNTGKLLTPSTKQFYYGASKYLKDHLSTEQMKLFK